MSGKPTPDGKASSTITSTKLSLGRIVWTTGRHTHKLIRFDNVRGQTTTIHAAGIEADCVQSPARFGRRPVAKEDGSFSPIHFVPGNAPAGRWIRAHCSYLRQVAGHLVS